MIALQHSVGHLSGDDIFAQPVPVEVSCATTEHLLYLLLAHSVKVIWHRNLPHRASEMLAEKQVRIWLAQRSARDTGTVEKKNHRPRWQARWKVP